MFGYGGNFEVSSILEAEIQVILDRIKILRDKRMRQLLVESDSKIAVNLVFGIGRM